MRSNQILPILTTAVLLASCGNADTTATTSTSTETTTTGATSPAASEALVMNPPKPADVTFAREDFEGMGTLELPTGDGWKRSGNEIINAKWNATIVIQSQPQGMTGMEKDFLESYNDVNLQDAPNWNRGTEAIGTLNGVRTARTEGAFNNGTAMRTRDYIFFGPDKTAIVQMRIAEANAAHLAPVIDYIASSFQPK